MLRQARLLSWQEHLLLRPVCLLLRREHLLFPPERQFQPQEVDLQRRLARRSGPLREFPPECLL